jgi:hypothetical protein
MMLLSTIIQTFEAEFLATYQNALLPSQRKALAALKQCRTTQSPVMLANATAAKNKSSSRIPAAIATVLIANIMKASNGWNGNSKNKCRPSIFC